jgi:hypothetical protein
MDIYHLAQVHYHNGEYIHCQEILCKNKLSDKSLWAKYCAIKIGCWLLNVVYAFFNEIKLENWDQALKMLGESELFQSQKGIFFLH